MIKRLPWMAYARFLAILCACFFPIYAIGAAYGMHTRGTWHLYLDWELEIPFIPWMVIPYLSLFPAYLVPLFTLGSAELSRLTRQSVLVIVICGLCFILVPTTTGFDPVRPAGHFAALFELINRVDGPYNLVPSLHVAGGALVLLGSAQAASKEVAIILRAWLGIMITSTIFVHQHHLVDAAAGLLLAMGVRRFRPLRPSASPAA